MITLKKRYPYVDFRYMSDSANFPYGSKSRNVLTDIATQNLLKAGAYDCSAVILACNTLSTNCMEDLSGRFPSLPFFGVVPPDVSRLNVPTLLFCTEATENSTYIMKAKRFNKNLFVYPCAELVSKIEADALNADKTDVGKHVARALEKAGREGFTKFGKIVLGCTHFCFVKKRFEQMFYGSRVEDGFELFLKKFQGYVTTFWDRGVTDDHNGKVSFIFSDKKRNFKIFNKFYN